MAGLFLLLFQVGDGCRVTEKKAEMVCRLQGVLECRVGMDGEIGRDKGKFAAGTDLLSEEVSRTPTGMVVA